MTRSNDGSVTTITKFVCVESNAAANGELGSAAHCIFDSNHGSVSSHRAVCMRPNLHQAPRYACIGVIHIWVLYLDGAHMLDAVHIGHKIYL